MPPSPPRLFSGFSLQAGVFSNPQLAEELHARLTLSGVPSTMETRVQVGPFRTRQEAEAAQAKLRGLGIETVLVPPRGARR
jgi:DedD protein